MSLRYLIHLSSNSLRPILDEVYILGQVHVLIDVSDTLKKVGLII